MNTIGILSSVQASPHALFYDPILQMNGSSGEQSPVSGPRFGDRSYRMPLIYQPTWQALKEVLESSVQQALVCSPYITSSGVDNLFDFLPGGVGLEVITRLSPSDWASGASDPEAILALLALWRDEGNPTMLRVAQRLHAKVYAADDLRVLVGSSNLSEGGFDRNIELIVELSGGAAGDTVRALHAACAGASQEVTLDRLESWIDRSRTTVIAARASAAEEPELLAGVQADLDSMLGFGIRRSASDSALPSIDRFVAWLSKGRKLSGAEVILDRHWNTGRQNLMGHVKQCSYGSSRFLAAYPAYVRPVSDALDELSKGDIYQMVDPPGLKSDWADYLDTHALDQGEVYSFPTLRGILPPSLGGTRQGGGGGISTLKRIMPLVARFVLHGP